jgi:ATP-dependent protease ClpP protease subunit
MSAQEAVDYGLIDAVVQKPQMVMPWKDRKWVLL